MDPSTVPAWVKALMVVWGILAAFVGLKGIQYVAKVATYIPLIPLITLIWLFAKTAGSIGSFDPNTLVSAHQALAPTAPAKLAGFGVIAAVLTYVVGFFATAGAAGVDIAMSGRDKNDVSMGGLIGIALAILVTAGISLLVVAGVYGSTELSAKAIAAGTEKKSFILDSFSLISVVMSGGAAKWMMFLLAVAAFPPACFSSFIAANSFRTTLPNVNPFISVGIGTAVSIVLALTGLAGKVIPVFVIIGASFGPICGAMMVDYLLNGKKWSGPRAAFNPAGWIAWALGFVVGILPNLGVAVPAAPVAAFVVGAVVFFLCAKMGMQSKLVPLSGALAEATK
jgi:cytosine permease